MEYAYIASASSYAPAGTVVAGTGAAGSGLNQLNGPGGLALDAGGNLIVADTYNNRVEKFAYDRTTGSYAATATTIAGNGTYGTAANELEWPSSVALDATGDLFVADRNNGRLLAPGPSSP
jgi:sugar lactone lactonase YvrE